MLDDILAIPDHLRDALWRVESARLEPAEAAGLIVCGMGGSAIGGDLAAAALGGRLTAPFVTVRGYGLPSWVTSQWTVLCSSYSGNTEETLACFAAAEALGARRIVASTGGALVDGAREAGLPVIGLPGILPAPRTAVAYMLVCAAEVAALAGIAPRIDTDIDAAAAFLTERSGDLQTRAAEIAARLGESSPVVIGADLTTPVARRWKTQINENAKCHAFFSELPEANHNEICGWSNDAFAAVLLEDPDQHPRERRRFELTGEAIAATGAPVVRQEAEGETRLARLLWATMLGDLVSLKLAEARGVDPLPVEAIEGFKVALGSGGE
ncbi:MAG TPA: bifunctional phosphoglucose/phosphomannose isomerase [Solirubrobacterales bacterium]|jgi:glucose/mannose-6-phosphate isomerase|nr:bifunctional phosphoglucose/phosphomannose isomerase [Solirubrobacterales bacterium]